MTRRQRLLKERITILFGVILIFIAIFLVLNYGEFFTERELSPLIIPVVNEFDLPYGTSTGLTYDGKSLWVSSAEEQQITAIDKKTGEVLKSFKSPGHSPWGLAWDGDYLWIVDYSTLKLYKMNPANGEILFNMTAPGVTPSGLTFDGDYLYVADFFTEKIYQVNKDSGTVISTNRTPNPGKKPSGLAWDGESLWIADVSISYLFKVDPGNWNVLSYHYSSGYFPGDIAWDGLHLWILDFSENKIYETIPGEIETLRVRLNIPNWYWTLLFIVLLPIGISIVGALNIIDEGEDFYERKTSDSRKKWGLPLLANVLGVIGSIYTSYELLRLIYSLSILKQPIVIDFEIFWLYRIEMLLALYTLSYWIYHSVLKIYFFYTNYYSNY
jgi:glutamine cyclotransferase